jgi:hypothetical protein
MVQVYITKDSGQAVFAADEAGTKFEKRPSGQVFISHPRTDGICFRDSRGVILFDGAVTDVYVRDGKDGSYTQGTSDNIDSLTDGIGLSGGRVGDDLKKHEVATAPHPNMDIHSIDGYNQAEIDQKTADAANRGTIGVAWYAKVKPDASISAPTLVGQNYIDFNFEPIRLYVSADGTTWPSTYTELAASKVGEAYRITGGMYGVAEEGSTGQVYYAPSLETGQNQWNPSPDKYRNGDNISILARASDGALEARGLLAFNAVSSDGLAYTITDSRISSIPHLFAMRVSMANAGSSATLVINGGAPILMMRKSNKNANSVSIPAGLLVPALTYIVSMRVDGTQAIVDAIMQVDMSNVTGTLVAANGGTGQTTAGTLTSLQDDYSGPRTAWADLIADLAGKTGVMAITAVAADAMTDKPADWLGGAGVLLSYNVISATNAKIIVVQRESCNVWVATLSGDGTLRWTGRNFLPPAVGNASDVNLSTLQLGDVVDIIGV